MVSEYNFCNGTIRWELSKSTRYSHTFFCAISYRFRGIQMLNFLPSKSRSRSWSAIFKITMENVKIYKCLAHIFARSTYRVRDVKFLNIWLLKVGQGHGVLYFLISPFDGKCQNLHTSFLTFFLFSPVLAIVTDTQRHTETHRDTQRHTEIHRDTQRHTETHRDTQRHTETHRDTQRHTETHIDTQQKLTSPLVICESVRFA